MQHRDWSASNYLEQNIHWQYRGFSLVFLTAWGTIFMGFKSALEIMLTLYFKSRKQNDIFFFLVKDNSASMEISCGEM